MASQDMPARGRRIAYVPALDGMRGISLPGTIYTHFAIFLGYLPTAGPWVRHAGPFTLNIEMFFVLSGALITSLLVSEHERTGGVTLSAFYLRRSRRLAPALIAVVPLLLVAQYALPGISSTPLGNSAWLTAAFILLFVGNWRMAAGGSLGWMGPAWTLGIEEQFYLTWPALLRRALRRGWGRREVLLAIWVVVVIGVAVSTLVYRGAGWDWTVYLTPTQLPPILLGCALGYTVATHDDGWFVRLLRSGLVGFAGLAGMVAISILAYRSFGFLAGGGYVAYAACACLLIGHCLVAADRPSLLGRFFGWKPFVVIGQVSYEAYLVHCIVILAVLRVAPTMPVNDQVLLDVTLISAISGAFYYFIERPIRRRGWKVLLGRGTPPARPPATVRRPIRLGAGVFATLVAGLATVAAVTAVVITSGSAGSRPVDSAVQQSLDRNVGPGPLDPNGAAALRPGGPHAHQPVTAPSARVPVGSVPPGAGAGGPTPRHLADAPTNSCSIRCGPATPGRSLPPTLTGLAPATGPIAGGTTVTIEGSHFTRAAQVRFGSLRVSEVRWVSSRRLIVTAPPAELLQGEVNRPLAHLHGLVAQVVVTTAGGRTGHSMLSMFTYI